MQDDRPSGLAVVIDREDGGEAAGFDHSVLAKG